MMGLPAGWVTDVPGVTRNDALRLLGNGVVPQQAAAAVGELLQVAADATAPPPEVGEGAA
jgi:DNA (cytosine-5)-methyltransferase 1